MRLDEWARHAELNMRWGKGRRVSSLFLCESPEVILVLNWFRRRREKADLDGGERWGISPLRDGVPAAEPGAPGEGDSAPLAPGDAELWGNREFRCGKAYEIEAYRIGNTLKLICLDKG